MKYKGGGFIVGVPARNLTTSEVKLYGKDRLLSSGLYVETLLVREKVKEVEYDKRD